jgi:ABC-type transporter Mla maintaining outer membrane lipid asymmetry ATPase subunit MlaF
MPNTPSAQLRIVVSDLRKSFGDNAVLRGVSFAVERGEVFALLGVVAEGFAQVTDDYPKLRAWGIRHGRAFLT